MEKIFQQIQITVDKLIDLYASLKPEQVNTVPYEGSWTAGQLMDHVHKSTSGLGRTLSIPFQDPGRPADAAIPKLEATFMNFESKLKSPDFITPGTGPFNQTAQIAAAREDFQSFMKKAQEVELNSLLTGLPLGDITKLELVHFVYFHTARHTHQMEKIAHALKK